MTHAPCRRVMRLRAGAIVWCVGVVVIALGADPACAAGRGRNRNDRAIREQIAKFERELKDLKAQQAVEKQKMDAAIAEGERVKPLLAEAERKRDLARDALSEARRASAEAVRVARERASDDPAVRSAKEKLDRAETARVTLAQQLEQTLSDDPSFQVMAERVAAAEQTLEVAKAGGDQKAIAAWAIELGQARAELRAYRDAALSVNPEYAWAAESVAAAAHRLDVAEKAANAELAESPTVVATGRALGVAERTYREARAEAFEMQVKFNRAESVYKSAQGNWSSLERQIREVQDDISNLRRANTRGRNRR